LENFLTLSETGRFKRYTSRGAKGVISIDRGTDKICAQALAALAEGDREALGVIYDRMARLVFTAAYAVLGNVQEAEDVLQDTLIEIAACAHAYRPGGSAAAWMLTVARHTAIDALRRRRPTVPIEDAQPELSVHSEGIAAFEAAEMLRLLGEDERQIVVFRLYSRLPYGHIAGIMGITVAAAQKKYQRALKKLRNEYR